MPRLSLGSSDVSSTAKSSIDSNPFNILCLFSRYVWAASATLDACRSDFRFVLAMRLDRVKAPESAYPPGLNSMASSASHPPILAVNKCRFPASDFSTDFGAEVCFCTPFGAE